MVGGLKIIQVKPGLEQAFEKTFTELRSAMWENEFGLSAVLTAQVQEQSKPLHCSRAVSGCRLAGGPQQVEPRQQVCPQAERDDGNG